MILPRRAVTVEIPLIWHENAISCHAIFAKNMAILSQIVQKCHRVAYVGRRDIKQSVVATDRKVALYVELIRYEYLSGNLGIYTYVL